MLDDLGDDEFLTWAREAGFAELAELMLWRWDPEDRAGHFPESAGWYVGTAQSTLYGLRAGDDRDRFVQRIRANAIDGTEPAYSDEALTELYDRVERWLGISPPLWRFHRDLAVLRALPFHCHLGEDPVPEAAVAAVLAICRESGLRGSRIRPHLGRKPRHLRGGA